MIFVLDPNAPEELIAHLLNRIRELGLTPRNRTNYSRRQRR